MGCWWGGVGWGWGMEVKGTISEEELLVAKGSRVDGPPEERKPYGWSHVPQDDAMFHKRVRLRSYTVYNTKGKMLILYFSMKESLPQFQLGFDGLVISTT